MYIKKAGMGTNSQEVVQGKRTHVLNKEVSHTNTMALPFTF